MDYLEMPFIPPRQAKYLGFLSFYWFPFFSQGTVSSFLPGLSNHVFLHILANSLYLIPGLHYLLLRITVGILPEQEQLEKTSSQGSKCPHCFLECQKNCSHTFMKKGSRPHFQWDICVSDWSYSLSQTSEDEKLMTISGRATFRGVKPKLLIRRKHCSH